jgi:virginiamycin B lyase
MTVPGHVFTSYPTYSSSSVPVDITVGADGTLYYTESGIDRIGRINTSGSPVGEYKTLSSNTGLKGIVGSTDGSIWFCESNTSKVGRLVL